MSEKVNDTTGAGAFRPRRRTGGGARRRPVRRSQQSQTQWRSCRGGAGGRGWSPRRTPWPPGGRSAPAGERAEGASVASAAGLSGAVGVVASETQQQGRAGEGGASSRSGVLPWSGWSGQPRQHPGSACGELAAPLRPRAKQHHPGGIARRSAALRARIGRRRRNMSHPCVPVVGHAPLAILRGADRAVKGRSSTLCTRYSFLSQGACLQNGEAKRGQGEALFTLLAPPAR
jgi:hypothetical protein